MNKACRVLLVHQFGLPMISGLTITLAALTRLIPEIDKNATASCVTYGDDDPVGLVARIERDHRDVTCVVGLNLHIEVAWDHTIALAGWCLRNRIPLVLYAHDYWPHHRDGVATLTERFGASLLAITPAIVADLLGDGFHATLLPAGVAVSDECSRSASRASGPKTVGAVGRIVPRKRLVDVAAAYCQAAFDVDAALCMRLPPSLVYGDTQDGERLAEIMQALTRCPRAESVTIDRSPGVGVDYWRWSVYVSASEYEGVSMTPLEALLQGCPVVLSDIPPHRQIVDALFPGRRQEFIFPVGDRAALAEKIRHELQTSERRTEIAARHEEIYGIIRRRWSLANTARGLVSIARSDGREKRPRSSAVVDELGSS